eukprot:8507582-Prorocentrum_lima.AAC.1
MSGISLRENCWAAFFSGESKSARTPHWATDVADADEAQLCPSAARSKGAKDARNDYNGIMFCSFWDGSLGKVAPELTPC